MNKTDKHRTVNTEKQRMILNKTCLFINCKHNKPCSCRGISDKHFRQEPVCDYFYDRMEKIDSRFIERLKEKKEAGELVRVKQNENYRLCELHNRFQEEFIKFYDQKSATLRLKHLQNLIDYDQQTIGVFQDELASLSRQYFQSNSKDTSIFNQILQIFKIYEFSKSKNNEYFRQVADEYTELLIDLDRRKMASSNIEQIQLGFRLLNYRGNSSYLEDSIQNKLYQHCIQQIFQQNCDRNELLFQYYQMLWNLCLVNDRVKKEFRDGNYVLKTSQNYIYQFEQLDLQLQEMILMFLMSQFKTIILGNKSYLNLVTKMNSNIELYNRHIRQELEDGQKVD